MTKPFIVGTWYRSPDANADIMMDFESLIDHIETLGLEVNIIGDFNCNVGATLLESHTKRLLDICNLYQYHQLIREPTRITEKKQPVQLICLLQIIMIYLCSLAFVTLALATIL